MSTIEKPKSLTTQIIDGVKSLMTVNNTNDDVKSDNTTMHAIASTMPDLTVSDELVIAADVVNTITPSAPVPNMLPRQAGGNMDENSDYYKMKYYKYKHLYLNAK
jgi:hypothetical protein